MPLPRRSPRSTPRASTTVVPRSLQPLLQQARQTISDQQAITTLQANMAALITRGNVAPAPRVPLSAAPEKCDLDMTPAAFRYPALRSPTTDTDADLDEDLTEAVAAVVIATAEHEGHVLDESALRPLSPGTRVRMQNQASGTWDRTGLIVEALPYRQYTVRLDGSGRISLRNRKHLRPVAESTPPPAPPTLRPPTTTPAQVSTPTQPQLRSAPRRQVKDLAILLKGNALKDSERDTIWKCILKEVSSSSSSSSSSSFNYFSLKFTVH
ncbi:hypothetical protein O3P69_001252 [Scylla paramamosain]|uniref:Uncharacterized protein n=1 Tax=Scylla paramamosain TaxID=85552 RepID=A0AAW0US68_SCYPA